MESSVKMSLHLPCRPPEAHRDRKDFALHCTVRERPVAAEVQRFTDHDWIDYRR